MERYLLNPVAPLFLIGAGCMVGSIDSPTETEPESGETQSRGDDYSWEAQFFDTNGDSTLDAVDVDSDQVIDYFFDYASCSSCMSAGLSALAVCTRPIVDRDDDGLPDGLDFDCDGIIDVELFRDCDGFPFCDGGDGGDDPFCEGFPFCDSDDGGGDIGDDGADDGDGNGQDGNGEAGQDGTTNEESGNGGISSVSICSVSVGINGRYLAVSCERRGGEVSQCTCEDGASVYTCETTSDSACSIPNGNCCGFVL